MKENSFICSECGASVPNNAKFCPNCGEKFEDEDSNICEECGEEIPEGSNFCPNCGEEVEEEEVIEIREMSDDEIRRLKSPVTMIATCLIMVLFGVLGFVLLIDANKINSQMARTHIPIWALLLIDLMNYGVSALLCSIASKAFKKLRIITSIRNGERFFHYGKKLIDEKTKVLIEDERRRDSLPKSKLAIYDIKDDDERCSNCNHILRQWDKTCPSCGKSVEDDDEEDSEDDEE